MKQISQRGFTLVELMVVVAIIGILSAIAVPNFKKYKEKAKMTEIKTNLSSWSTAFTNFELDNNTYAAGNLAALGLADQPRNNFVMSASAAISDACGSGACQAQVASTAAEITYKSDNANASTTALVPAAGGVTVYGYGISAAATIMNDACYVWMNQDQQIAYRSVAATNGDVCRQ